jgi:hypothetical protein
MPHVQRASISKSAGIHIETIHGATRAIFHRASVCQHLARTGSAAPLG